MKRIKPQHFLILLLVAALAAAPFLIRGLIDRSSVCLLYTSDAADEL